MTGDLVSRLLPCPHCGGKARTWPVRDGRQAGCAKCHSMGPPEYFGPKTILSAEERAIAAWNRRVPDQQAADRIAALEHVVRLADQHLSTIYPNGVKDGDFLCTTVRAAVAPGD